MSSRTGGPPDQSMRPWHPGDMADGVPSGVPSDGMTRTAVLDAPEAQRKPLTFASLLRDGAARALGLNSRWLRTVRGLVTNAGATVAEYVDGVRERYSHPVTYALGSITAYVVTRRFLASDAFLFDPIHIVGTILPYISIPLLIPAALLMNALFRRLRIGAAECYVLILYVGAQVALIETALTIVLHLGVPEWLVWPVRALQGLYAALAVVAFTGERRWHGWVRGLLVAGAGAGALYATLYGIMAWVWHGLF